MKSLKTEISSQLKKYTRECSEIVSNSCPLEEVEEILQDLREDFIYGHRISVISKGRSDWSDFMTTLATRIQSSLSDPEYEFSNAALDCISALVTDGYLLEDVLSAAKIQSSWIESKHWPRAAEVHKAAELVTLGYLTEDVMTKLATRIQSSWSDWNYYPSVAEVECAAALAATGHLTSVQWST